MRSRYGDMGKKNFGQDRRKTDLEFPFRARSHFLFLLPFLSLFFFLARDLSVDDVPFSSFDLSEPVLFYFIILLSRNFFSSLCYFLLLFSSLFRSPSTVNATILFIIVIISIIVIVINIIVYLFIVYYYSYCYYYYHYHHIVCG